MRYIVRCQCGKKLESKDPIVGRKIRCPVCGETVKTATESTPPPVPTVAAPPPIPKPPPAPKPPPVPLAATPYRVFISYSAKDQAVAAGICSTLENQHVRCWIAPRDIVPGKEWGEAIIEGLGGCRIMVLIYSGNSNQSPQVRREVERAVNKGLVIVPFRIEDVPMAKSLEYFLSSPHWLDALTRPLEPHVAKLAATIQSLLREGSDAKRNGPAPAITPAAKPRKRLPLMLAAAGAGVAMIMLALFLAGVFKGTPAEAVADKGPGGKEPEPAKPGEVVKAADPTGRMISPSEVTMRDGTLQVRSLRLETFPVPLPANPAEKTIPPRWVVVSNRDELPAKGQPPASMARVHFQINNNSYEGATLAKVEMSLLGVVDLYEDQILEPRAPDRLQFINSMEIPFGRARTVLAAADVRKLFGNSNDPPGELRIEATSNLPATVTASIDAQHRLQLALPGTKGGTAHIMVRATNPFDQSTVIEFDVTSVPKPPVVLKKLEAKPVTGKGARTVADFADMKTVFADSGNDPPTALRYEVTSDLPEVASGKVDAQGKLQLSIGKFGGTANLTVRATNAYDLSESINFTLFVQGEPLPENMRPRIVPRLEMPFQLNQPVQKQADGVLSIPAYQVDKETQRLTNVQFNHALKRHESVAAAASGNLLPEEADSFLKPNVGKRFSADIALPVTLESPLNMPKDLLSGTRQRQLAAHRPELRGTCHLLALSVEIISEDGQRHELSGDRIYAFYSSPQPNELDKDGRVRSVITTLGNGDDKETTQLLTALLKWGVRNNAETVAFQRAGLCGVAPASLDPLAIDPLCFYGNPASVYRQPGATLSAASETWTRTNLPRVFQQACQAHPKLGAQLTAALTKLAADNDPALARRAGFVSEQIRTPPESAVKLIESKPPRPVVVGAKE